MEKLLGMEKLQKSISMYFNCKFNKLQRMLFNVVKNNQNTYIYIHKILNPK